MRALLLAALFVAGCASGPARTAPGDLSFGFFGDAPYSQPHANLLDGVIGQMNRAPLAFVVHAGDITAGSGPCTDEWFEARAKQFAQVRHPFVLVFGDNEWTDCHGTGFDPLERLAKLRAIFHSRDPKLQGFARQDGAYREHTRWIAGRSLFLTLNVPGSNNNLGRTPAMDREHEARMAAVLAWLEDAVKLAAAPSMDRLVVFMHADPNFAQTRSRRRPDGYARLLDAFRTHAGQLKKPFIVAHGDTHRFRQDRPLEGAPNLTRLEVDGWPWLGWLKVGLSADPTNPVNVARLLNQ